MVILRYPHSVQSRKESKKIIIILRVDFVNVVKKEQKIVCNNILGDLSKKIDDLSDELTHTRGEKKHSKFIISSFSVHFSFGLLRKRKICLNHRQVAYNTIMKGYRLFDSLACWIRFEKILFLKLNLKLNNIGFGSVLINWPMVFAITWPRRSNFLTIVRFRKVKQCKSQIAFH